MPDRTIFIRPSVTVGGAVPAIATHPGLLNFTDAASVTNGPGLGTVNVRVGQGLNANVTLGTETTVAGAGHTTTLVAGDAVGGGPSDGGAIILQPGVGVGGGANGAVVPYADNVVGLGSITAAFLEIAVNSVYSLNQDLLVAGLTTTFGVDGNNLLLRGASAIIAGNGGSVRLRPGNGAGAGVRGNILLDDDGSALNVLPTTTNLVTVGSASLALAAVRTNDVRSGTGVSLVLAAPSGGSQFTLNTASGIQWVGTLFCGDQQRFALGSGTPSDFLAKWSTDCANNGVVFSTGVNSAAQSGNIIITTAANINNEHGLAAVTTPRLAIFSAADMSVAGNRTQYIQMYHDGSNPNFVAGVGTFLFNRAIDVGANSVGCGQVGNGGSQLRILFTANVSMNFRLDGVSDQVVFNGASNGVTMATFTQRANTSGTPTGLLWTAGAHAGLANASMNDWNIDLSRTVTFLGGGSTNFGYYRGVAIDAPELGAVTAGLSVDVASTVYIAGPPTAEDGDITLTSALSLFVDAGNVRFDGTIQSNGGAQTICDASGNLASANGVAAFGPAAPASITIVNGIVTAIS